MVIDLKKNKEQYSCHTASFAEKAKTLHTQNDLFTTYMQHAFVKWVEQIPFTTKAFMSVWKTDSYKP